MAWNERRVIITGAGGFAGRHLARLLTAMGAEVYGLVRRHPEQAGGNPQGIPCMRRIIGDLEDYASLVAAAKEAVPDVVFHLGAQSFVPRSFSHPLETAQINCIGTNNLLEAVRTGCDGATVVFAGSSEEYGLVFSSARQYELARGRYGVIFPEPSIPEVPIRETNPLRPMSPYAVSKVYGDHLTRNYYHTYGLRAVVSRAFNHEGPGRGAQFVTSIITGQVRDLASGKAGGISIGNVSAFRDWSHVSDIVRGYVDLADRGASGDVYNLGTMRTASVLTYLLTCLGHAGFPADAIEAARGGKRIECPLRADSSPMFGLRFEKSLADRMLLEGTVDYTLEDGGITVTSGTRKIPITFDAGRFRPAEVPILLADTTKAKSIGFSPRCSLNDVIRDQMGCPAAGPGA